MLINDQFENFKIEIKHGCTEYYKSYPKFQNLNLIGNEEVLIYDKSWKMKEDLIDKLEPLRSELNKKVWVESKRGVNLSDLLIIKNWISYADLIGDYSYKKIYDKKINHAFMSNALQNQLNFRIEDLKK